MSGSSASAHQPLPRQRERDHRRPPRPVSPSVHRGKRSRIQFAHRHRGLPQPPGWSKRGALRCPKVGPVDKPPPATLLERLRDPGFTPRLREVDGLVDLLADEDLGKAAARAIGRVGPAALEPLRARLEAARPPLRAHVVKAIGRLAPEPSAVAVLLAALEDADAKTRRNAAIALGHVARADVEDALLAAWERDPSPPMRRTLAASLGKIRDRAVALRCSRRPSAPATPSSRGSRAAPGPWSSGPPRAACAGASLRHARRRGRCPSSPCRVAGSRISWPTSCPAWPRWSRRASTAPGASGRALRGRSTPCSPRGRCCRFTSPCRARRGAPGDALADDHRPCGDERGREGHLRHVDRRAGPLPDRLGRGRPPASRDLGRVARHRGRARRSSSTIRPRRPGRSSSRATTSPSIWRIAPRSLVDPRFSWRRGDVPAASHPTLAAALARVAGARDDDVVWDPFVGSGAELAERALLGPALALFGSDVDPRALEVARANLAGAGIEARLELQDALEPAPEGVTLIITNPPMGRRAARDGRPRRAARPLRGARRGGPRPARPARVDGALAGAGAGRRAARRPEARLGAHGRHGRLRRRAPALGEVAGNRRCERLQI